MSRRALFWIGVVGLIVTEIANVYFIMPLPGSQTMQSIDLAYTIHGARWWLRAVFGALLLVGIRDAWERRGWRRWLAATGVVFAALVVYAFNFVMSADHMFLQPRTLTMVPAAQNKVSLDRLVVGVDLGGEARAYPLRFIGYHHQVADKVGGQDVLVTYCTVCRTGRVYAPTVAGKHETFRLVGMDHWNAMLEDGTTHSWWRQANGEAITGARKGDTLPELPYMQVTLREWLRLHPNSLVMQPDPAFESEYWRSYAYERGTSRGDLTGTDTTSWGEKSWVVGVMVNGRSKAYDWKRLRRERVVNDEVGGTPVVVAIGSDGFSYAAFRRPDSTTRFTLHNDSLATAGASYALSGEGPGGRLDAVAASQEYWHSWRTFQPGTERY